MKIRSNTPEAEEYTLNYSKMNKLLKENRMTFAFDVNTYPISLTIWQADKGQIIMDIPGVEETSANDAELKLIFRDADLTVMTDSRLVISNTLFDKIKGLAKKLYYSYLAAYFRYVAENQSRPVDFVVINGDSDEITEEDYNKYLPPADMDDSTSIDLP